MYCGQALDTLLSNIHAFRSTDNPMNMSTHGLDQAHLRSIGLIEALDKQETIYLLQTWHLSLAMCDVSFFVMLQIPCYLHILALFLSCTALLNYTTEQTTWGGRTVIGCRLSTM
jgi:hypothetical protein